MIPKETLLAQLLEIKLPHPVGHWNRRLQQYDPAEMVPYAFIRIGESVVHVSSEDGHLFCNYYSEGAGPWIHPVLVKFAADRGMFWEWENPACMGLYEL